jgi:hypothetical protein
MVAYVPPTTETRLRKFALSLQQLAAGRSNATGTVTLLHGAASTTVTDRNCAAGSAISLHPTTADASAEVGNGTIYIPTATILNGSFVIAHANNSQTDRIFLYAIKG